MEARLSWRRPLRAATYHAFIVSEMRGTSST